MKYTRLLTALFGFTGAVGLLLMVQGYLCNCGRYPNGWSFVGVSMFVAAVVGLVCLLIFALIDAVGLSQRLLLSDGLE